MTLAQRTTRILGISALPLLVAVFLAFGPRGFAGAAMGYSLGILSIWSFALLLLVLNPNTPSSAATTRWVALLWMVKLPAIGLSVYFAGRIGAPATGCFLGGLSLVYLALVGTALSLK